MCVCVSLYVIVRTYVRTYVCTYVRTYVWGIFLLGGVALVRERSGGVGVRGTAVAIGAPHCLHVLFLRACPFLNVVACLEDDKNWSSFPVFGCP